MECKPQSCRRDHAVRRQTRAQGGLLVLILLVSLTACEDRSEYVKVRLTSAGRSVPAPRLETPGKIPLRVALAAVVSPRSTLESYGTLLNYLGERAGRPVKLIQGLTYAEVNERVRSGDVDVAFICTNAYVEGHRQFGMELLVTPQVRGTATYHSYIIVPQASETQTVLDLKGKVFAFTDPMSHTGRLVPLWLLSQMGEQAETFFRRTLFTYSHDNSIQAVADQLVDGAAVDSLVYDFAIARMPQYAARTRIIWKSPPYAAPPVVVHPSLNPELKEQLRRIFLDMDKDERGQAILKDLMIDRFVVLDDAAYDSVRAVGDAVRGLK